MSVRYIYQNKGKAVCENNVLRIVAECNFTDGKEIKKPIHVQQMWIRKKLDWNK